METAGEDAWVLLTHSRFHHHGSHSGYNQLLKHLSGEVRVAELGSGRGVRGAASDLLATANEARRLRRRRVFHLYPEQTLAPTWPRPRLEVAACHQPPSALGRSDPRVRVLRRSLRRTSRVIALGPAQLAWLTSQGFDASFVPHGVDASFFVPAAAPPRKELLCVSGWLRDERQLREYSAVAHSAGFEVRRIGQGMPRLNDDEYRAALMNSAGVLLSIPDGVASNAVLEAAACGKPVIGDLGPDTSWYLGDQNRAFLSKPVAEQLAEVVRSGRAIGASNRDRAEECSWPAVARKLSGVLSEVR